MKHNLNEKCLKLFWRILKHPWQPLIAQESDWSWYATLDVPPTHLSPNLLTNQSPNFSNILLPNLLPNPCKNAHPISSPNTTQSLTLPPPQLLTQPFTQPLTHPLTQQLWLTWNYSIRPNLFPLDSNWRPLDQPHLILNLTQLFATWPSFTQCDIPCTYLTQSDSTWTLHGLLNS